MMMRIPNIRSILKLAGKGESKVAAVFGFSPASCHRAVVHLRKGVPEVPVWLFATLEPSPETAALCDRVLVRRSSWLLMLDAFSRLWPVWVALSVAPWTGGHGKWPLKVGPFLVPPFRVLLQNTHGDFFSGTPAGVLRHLGRLLFDAADTVWNQLRTWSHAVGDRRRDLVYWLRGMGLSLRLPLQFILGSRWLGQPYIRLFHKLRGQEKLDVSYVAGSGREIVRFTQSGARWDAERLEELARSSSARWILWQDKPFPDESVADLLRLMDDPDAFAASQQTHFREWKTMTIPTAPFRTLQPGEVSRVLAPLSNAILVDRRKLLAIGIPRSALSGTAWMLIFSKAAAAGWNSYSVGQSRPLTEQPDFPMQEIGFVFRVLFDSALRRLGPREPALSRGSIAVRRIGIAPPSTRLKVLLVSPFLPYPLSHGGAVRIYNLCRALANRVDFILVAFREKNDFIDYDKLHEIFREVHVVDLDERPSKDQRLPTQVRGQRSASLRALIADLARTRRPDILQIEYTHMAGFRDAAPDLPAILVEHDLTYTLYRQLAAAKQNPTAQAEYQRWLAFEHDWLRRFEGVWTVSEDDRQTAIRDTGRDAAGAFPVPNGVDVDRFRPAGCSDVGQVSDLPSLLNVDTSHGQVGNLPHVAAIEPGARPEIFYVGSFRHLPNVLGFQVLYREVMPRIWTRFPNARLRVVAGPQHLKYWKGPLPDDPRIEIHGFVEDLRSLYARATMVAVPLEVSAGTNIKVLEAMACGKAVVSTPIGCAGLGLRDGIDVLIRSGWDEFAEAASDLLADPALRAGIGAMARRTTEERFSWPAIANSAYESYCALARIGTPV